MSQDTVNSVEKKKGTGVIAGVIAIVIAILGIFTFGVVFVPLAFIIALIGIVIAIKNTNIGGIALNVLAFVFVIVGFMNSPVLWIITGGLMVVESQEDAPNSRGFSLFGNSETFTVSVSKENRLYSINKQADGSVKVDNSYIFLLQNTLNKSHKYYFDVILPEGIKGEVTIDRPSKPFLAKPGVNKKTIVRLSTNQVLVEDARKDTVIPITINMYPLDNKDEIVSTETTFTYPRYDLIQNAQ